MKFRWIGLMTFLLWGQGLAASFDCTGVLSKIEKQICETGSLSRLDDELAHIYAGALALTSNNKTLQKQQLDWLKTRNKQCTSQSGPNTYTEAACLIHAYQARIKYLIKYYRELDGYTLLMSKDAPLCQHMLKLFTEDLQHYSRASNEHEEFNAVPWRPVRITYKRERQENHFNAEGALFDFNNDGLLDFVVRFHGALSGIPFDSIAMFGDDIVNDSSSIDSVIFFNANNFISLAGSFYNLSPPLEGQSVSLWLLSPFVYQGTSYLYMQSLYETNSGLAEDVMVVSKYKDGRYIAEEMTGTMDDICYFKRFGDVR